MNREETCISKSNKVLGHIDLAACYEWYAKFAKTTIEEIKSGERGINPTDMISDWFELDCKCERLCEEFIGKEVYFSIMAGSEMIEYDTCFCDCIIRKGVLEGIDDNKNAIIDGVTYILPKYSVGTLFDKLEYCILHLHFDGENMLDVSTEGDILLKRESAKDHIKIEC